MADEIKPVPPVYGIQPELPPRITQPPSSLQRRQPATHTASSRQSEGYDLNDITPQQAQQLLDMPLMQDERASANPHFAPLKEAITRRAGNAPAQQGDMPLLLTASNRIASLIVDTYGAKAPDGTSIKPTPSDLRAKIVAFHELAASFGKDRPVMRG